jgi:hypothetical protein
MKTSPICLPEVFGNYSSRRGFMFRTISLIATAAAFSLLAPLAVGSDAVPNAADLEIATLGDWLREADPEYAAQLEAEAREATRLTPTQTIDWPTAQRARAQLTNDVLVAAELERAEVVFLDGWLLTRSEAGAALLFAEARVQMQFQPERALAG